MNEHRLRLTIDVLHDVAQANKRFNMARWLGKRADERQDACGTAACAFGHAALDPRLQAEGLSLIGELNDTLDVVPIRTIADFSAWLTCPNATGYADPCFDGETGFDAATAFYDITYDAADYLFDPTSYPRDAVGVTPEDVITRIERVIELGGEAPDRDTYENEDEDET